MVFAQSELSY